MAYSLLSRIEDGIEPLLEIFEKYITTVGRDIILGLGASISKVPWATMHASLEICSGIFVKTGIISRRVVFLGPTRIRREAH